jgi:hypothetical protein
MNECFMFTSYSDTDERLNTSLNNLKNISNLGLDVCIYSHFPITTEEQLISDFSIYDSENHIPDMVNKSSVFWNRFENIYMEYHLESLDWAIITQWIKGLKFLLNMGYNTIHVVNYDISLDFDTFSEYKKLVDNRTSFFRYKEKYPIQTYLFTVDETVARIISNIKYEEYMKSNYVFAEDFIYDYLHSYKFYCNFIEYENWVHIKPAILESEITMGTHDMFSAFNMSMCRLVVGDYDGNVAALVYNIKEPITLDINNVEYEMSSGYRFVITEYPIEQLSELSICINKNEFPNITQLNSYKHLYFKLN